MGLNERIDAIERRLTPAQKVVFVIHVPPDSVQTREQHRAWSDELQRTVPGLWTTLNIGEAGVNELDEPSEAT